MLPLHQLRGGIKAVTSLEEPVPVKPANAPAISDTARTVLVCASIFIVWLAGATAVYSVAEGWSLAQSLFYAVDTGLSIGFGAFAEEKTSTKIFTICHVLLGASAAGGAIALFAESVVKNQGSMAALEYRKAALSAAFASADTSGDGEWCSQELDKALRSIGMRLSPDELKEAMGAFDHNEDGQIDHREFVEAVRTLSIATDRLQTDRLSIAVPAAPAPCSDASSPRRRRLARGRAQGGGRTRWREAARAYGQAGLERPRRPARARAVGRVDRGWRDLGGQMRGP